ncbi:hypothetical protein CcaCcLH18_00345 [Colletotrichum camelliae]|nr:hypothetical protein CcaCcLH18_00345 [Colletotrichum camelliae]
MSLILAWPAQFASPLATGSVSWVPTSSYDINSGKTIVFGSASIGPGRGAYKGGLNIRQGLVTMSAGLANLKATAPFEYNNGSLHVTEARRMATFLGLYTNGTVVRNATVPIFVIESLEWVNDESQIPSKILEAVQDPLSGYLNFTQKETQMNTAIGATTLLKDQPWKVPSTDGLPETVPVSHAVRYASIYVFSGEISDTYDCHSSINNTEFSPLPSGIHLVKSRRRDRSDCMAVAKLQISAGVTHCNQSEPTSSSPSCIAASNIMFSTNRDVFPDNLTGGIFAMMQEVHTVVASLRMNDPEIYAGRLEQSLRDSLVQTYQGTWSAMTEYFKTDNMPHGKLKTTGWEPVQALQAQVSSFRILLWLGMSMLLVLSGILVLVLDSYSEGKMVINPVIAAIMLDSSEVIAADDTGLCNAVDIGKDHGNTGLRLRLEVSKRSSMTGGYYHPKLVPEVVSVV